MLVHQHKEQPVHELDSTHDNCRDWELETDHQQAERYDWDICEELLVAELLIDGEFIPLIVSQLFAVQAITMVGVPTFRDISLEVFLVFLIELGSNLFILSEEFFAVVTSTEAFHEDVE